MCCEQEPYKVGREFFERFNLKAIQNRIPVVGGIELTSRCNLNCIHCYIPSKGRNGEHNQRELSTYQWMSLIDQFVESGCLYLLFTGGEAMLRPDFCAIYEHARKSGLLVTVFTNGTLINDNIIETFEKYPPHCVEISIYGATSKTYERVNRVRGSFEKCIQGIVRLKSHGFFLKLKTILLSENIEEIKDIEKLAANLGVSFRFDAMVFPKLDGDQAPVEYRVSTKDAVKIEFEDATRSKDWYKIFERTKKYPVSSELYQCSAGLTIFHVDSYGKLRPCLMVTDESYDLLKKQFKDVWHDKKFMRFRRKLESPVQCRDCNMKILCGYCPGFLKLENNSNQIHSEFLCELGKQRHQAIQHFYAGAI